MYGYHFKRKKEWCLRVSLVYYKHQYLTIHSFNLQICLFSFLIFSFVGSSPWRVLLLRRMSTQLFVQSSCLSTPSTPWVKGSVTLQRPSFPIAMIAAMRPRGRLWTASSTMTWKSQWSSLAWASNILMWDPENWGGRQWRNWSTEE